MSIPHGFEESHVVFLEPGIADFPICVPSWNLAGPQLQFLLFAGCSRSRIKARVANSYMRVCSRPISQHMSGLAIWMRAMPTPFLPLVMSKDFHQSPSHIGLAMGLDLAFAVIICFHLA